ncbi:chemotaxis protein CheX [Phycicoccus sonneratiae]|uniref:Chemotaxis protein CheX n=1 Tax=Phycicoccus sonneratiae TaxID=2807628 RepID=A0ABS2CPF6_9MICO|nr:chemotaxis protein CheX [Phycicoccus sonneraticus]MBM6401761.1 chemotaxis protein CheX [Phycicoccus sonneraticus]
MTTASPIESAYVDSIVSTVWESLFGEPAVATAPEPVPAQAIRARVGIHGGWTGSVVVSCGPDVASDLTRELLALPADSVPGPDEVHDALGEIANIVAGNVKSLLPAHAELGLPEVADGSGQHHLDGAVAATYLATLGPLRVDVTAREGR